MRFPVPLAGCRQRSRRARSQSAPRQLWPCHASPRPVRPLHEAAHASCALPWRSGSGGARPGPSLRPPTIWGSPVARASCRGDDAAVWSLEIREARKLRAERAVPPAQRRMLRTTSLRGATAAASAVRVRKKACLRQALLQLPGLAARSLGLRKGCGRAAASGARAQQGGGAARGRCLCAWRGMRRAA